MDIAFTGPRTLTDKQVDDIRQDFRYFISEPRATWHVGDASGLDALVRDEAKNYSKKLCLYQVEGSQPYHFAQRTKRMIDALSKSADPWLYAFPNKLCPAGCRPSKNPSGQGSGTWLAIAYARYLQIPVYFFPQFETKILDHSWIPVWMDEKLQTVQMNLF